MTGCQTKDGVKKAQVLISKWEDICSERRWVNGSIGAKNITKSHIDWEVSVVARYDDQLLRTMS